MLGLDRAVRREAPFRLLSRTGSLAGPLVAGGFFNGTVKPRP
jgi:hypothetical protein